MKITVKNYPAVCANTVCPYPDDTDIERANIRPEFGGGYVYWCRSCIQRDDGMYLVKQ
jgi:hypothetical protein